MFTLFDHTQDDINQYIRDKFDIQTIIQDFIKI